MKRNDLILFGAIVIFGLAILLANAALQKPGATAEVVSGQTIIGTYELRNDCMVVIEGDGDARNVVEISDGVAKMMESNCPNGDCMSQRGISRAGQSLVCLPNKVLVRIEGAGDMLDSIVH